MAILAITHKNIGAFNLILTYRQQHDTNPMNADEIAILLLKMAEMHNLKPYNESAYQYHAVGGRQIPS